MHERRALARRNNTLMLISTWRHLEIIVVDNGSTDRSLEIANSFKSSGVRVLECEKPGAAAARNVRIASASGQYIQFLDADDILAPTKIEIQVQRLSGDDPFAVAICPWGVFSNVLSEAAMDDNYLSIAIMTRSTIFENFG